jgi:uncharacterized protein (TIGR02246 family)
MDDLQRLLIERECERLIVAYTHINDLEGGKGIADLFTEDGVLEVPGLVRRGRAELEEAVAQRPKGMFMRHISTNAAVTVIDEDNAEAVSYLVAYVDRTPGGEPRAMAAPTVAGQYYDRFVRTERGWRIAHRRTEVALRRE